MATCCSPLTGNINKVCGAKKGGLIDVLYAANFCDVSGTTLASGEVIAIDMATNPITSQPFYFYQLGVKKNSAGFVNEAQIGDNNKFWNQTVSFTVEGFDTDTKAAFDSMIDGEAVFIAKDNAGIYHILGRNSGAMMTSGTIGTGVAATDLYGGTATFVAEELEITRTIASGTSFQVLNEDGVTIDTIVVP